MPSSDGGETERHLTIFGHALTMALAFGTCIFGSRMNSRPTCVSSLSLYHNLFWPRKRCSFLKVQGLLSQLLRSMKDWHAYLIRMYLLEKAKTPRL